MAVYVDDMNAPFGRMIMCHMIADTQSELLEMCDKIDLPRKWIQYEGHPWKEHFDVNKAKKKLAIENGAIEITQRELGKKLKKRLKCVKKIHKKHGSKYVDE